MEKRLSYVHAEKVPTDRQTAFRLYIVDAAVAITRQKKILASCLHLSIGKR